MQGLRPGRQVVRAVPSLWAYTHAAVRVCGMLSSVDCLRPCINPCAYVCPCMCELTALHDMINILALSRAGGSPGLERYAHVFLHYAPTPGVPPCPAPTNTEACNLACTVPKATVTQHATGLATAQITTGGDCRQHRAKPQAVRQCTTGCTTKSDRCHPQLQRCCHIYLLHTRVTAPGAGVLTPRSADRLPSVQHLHYSTTPGLSGWRPCTVLSLPARIPGSPVSLSVGTANASAINLAWPTQTAAVHTSQSSDSSKICTACESIHAQANATYCQLLLPTATRSSCCCWS